MRHKIVGLLLGGLVAATAGSFVLDAQAHGERNQEPFLRMRTTHFYDVKWSTDKIPVNGQIVVTGKFRLDPDWPANLPKPDVAFLGNGTPGPVLARTESYINGVPAIQSTTLEMNKEYEFKNVMRGRIPGRHHVHPMLNVYEAGPLLGPGAWLEITGDRKDFVLPAITIDGTKIDNLEVWGMETVVKWHLLWIALGLFWIFWWLLRPLIMPRYLALEAGYEDALVTNKDRVMAAVMLVVVFGLVIGGYNWAEAKYPYTVPLQAGRVQLEPLPESDVGIVKVFVNRASYDVPGRSMKLALTITNKSSKPVHLGELATANLRFINRSVPAAVAGVDPAYPAELVPKSGLVVSNTAPIQPGEKREMRIEATDVAWELERLTSFLNDPDNRMGGLLFFYTPENERIITIFSGAIVPVFTNI